VAMKLSIHHWIIALLALLGTIGPQVAQAFPSLAAVIGIFDQIDAAVLGVLGILTGSAIAHKGAAAVASGATKLLSILAVGLLVLMPGCKESALPVAEDIVQIVLADYAKGDVDSQIASDVCAELGGSSLTDTVCGDATQILADVLQYLLDAHQLSNQAQIDRAHAFISAQPKPAKESK
jgi:hypothetical protein